MKVDWLFLVSWLATLISGGVIGWLLAPPAKTEYVFVEDDGQGGIQPYTGPLPDGIPPPPDYVPETWLKEVSAN